MSSFKALINKTGKRTFVFINQILPKKNQVIVCGFPNAESSCIEVANYISKHYNYTVYFPVSPNYKDSPKALLMSNIRVISSSGGILNMVKYFYTIFRSKYIFMTHGLPIEKFSKKQIVVNIWHGVLYKKLGIPIGGRPIITDVTVGTSQLTKPMFSEAFGVSEESVLVSGYPRNDAMLNAQQNKKSIKTKLGNGFKDYKKIIIWLPTYRQRNNDDLRLDGDEVGNPFYIPDFDTENFNSILKNQNTLCIIKPHPMAVKYKADEKYSNLLFIDDKWVTDQGLSLYTLIGITDVLISDVSSIVIDYLLLNNPIICMSTDFDAYKESRGFYFKDIENWLPNLIKEEHVFLEKLIYVLASEQPIITEKVNTLKKEFFMNHDAQATKRLVNHVLGAVEK